MIRADLRSPASAARRVLKRAVSPSHGDLRLMTFEENGRALSAWCPDDETFALARELVLSRVYEQCPIRLSRCGGVVVDAGAHVGIFTLQAAQWAARVVALEANWVNHRILDLNLRRNGATNVEARWCALWSATDRSLAFRWAPHSGGGGIPESDESDEGADHVPAVSLDDLVEEVGTIDLLKIDIEGAEHRVLAAATLLHRVRRIVGELHLEDMQDPRLGMLERTLADAGFRTRIVTERSLYGARQLPQFVHNWGSLGGMWPTKLIGAAYLAAPIAKPIRDPGARYALPLLVAWKDGAA